jgi:hypothetical protein
MSTKDDDSKKKITGVGSSASTKGVKATESVSEIDKVKEAAAIKGIAGISGVGKAGPLGNITFEQRAKLMTIVTEETERLIAQGVIPKSQRDVVEQAVKMVIDASLLEPSEDKKSK